MYYRELKKCGVKLSVLSFGGMRWTSGEGAFKTLNRGMDNGMNYVDTSNAYLGAKSEPWVGNAVKHRRGDIYVSTKANWAKGPSSDDVRKAIDGSLERSGLDYFDFYQIWNLETMDVLNDVMKKGGTLEGIRKAMDEGTIRYGLGFTFHGTPDVFKAAIDTGVFVSTTVSYNILKRKEEELINYAGERDVGVIIMNPLGGGVLAFAGDESLSFLREDGHGPECGALRFLLSNKRITTSIIGAVVPQHIDQALAALKDYEHLDEEYQQRMIKLSGAVSLPEEDFCTGCEYCNKCPHEFRPAELMKAIRDFKKYGVEEERLQEWLGSRFVTAEKLEKCVECGQCMELCPQKLDIVAEIRRAKQAWGVEAK